MEKIYTRNQQLCKLTKTSHEKIRYLLDFSKSFHVMEYQSFKFESILN